MNLSEMEAYLKKQILQSNTLRMRVIAGIVILLVLGGLLWVQLTSPQIPRKKHQDSLQFGKALERAGNPNQPSPSK